MRPRAFAHAEFDAKALCRLASGLRHVACMFDINKYPAIGSCNWAVFLAFDDGVEWVFRSPYTGVGCMSMEIISKLLESEVATLKYVHENSDIPVPQVYSYSPTQTNEIGIPYILMSKATGCPLQKTWKSSGSEISLQDKAKVLFQLGDITWKLSQLRLDRIGSLFEQNGTFRVGECLSRGHLMHDRDSLEDIARGPFSSDMQFYDSLVDAFIQHAEALPLAHHCFFAPVPCREDYGSHDLYIAACDLWNDYVAVGCKIDSADNRFDYIIAGEALRGLISKWQQGLPSSSFPLCHPDLSVNNIYVDDEHNVTCIIDWQFCSSVPEGMVSIPPGLPQSRHELHGDLVGFFRDGFAQNQRIELMTIPMARCGWLLSRLLSFDSTDDYSLFAAVWEQIYGPEKDLRVYFAEQRSSSSNIQRHREMKEEDQSPEKTRDEELDYFRKITLRSSIARGLSVASQWTSRYGPCHHQRFRGGGVFLADSKLWNWMLKVRLEREDLLVAS